MVLLRRPVARSTTTAVLSAARRRRPRRSSATSSSTGSTRSAPVIAARRPPVAVEPRRARSERTRPARSRGRPRRRIRAAGIAARGSDHAGGRDPGPDRRRRLPPGLARPAPRAADVDPVNAVWETLRLTPPTWITARDHDSRGGSRRDRDPAGSGRLRQSAAPGPARPTWSRRRRRTDRFDPDRWQDEHADAGRLAAVRRRSPRLPGPHPRAWRSSSPWPGGASRSEFHLSEDVASTRVGASPRHRAGSPSAPGTEPSP